MNFFRQLIGACILLAAVALAPCSGNPVAQAPGAKDLQLFVGTWVGKLKGEVFVTVKLNQQGGKIGGTISAIQIELNDQGELTQAHQESNSLPIVESHLNNKVLTIVAKSTDQGEEEKFEYDMTITGKDEAQLQIKGVPGTPPKPWKLERK